jgi:hypothetical protein
MKTLAHEVASEGCIVLMNVRSRVISQDLSEATLNLAHLSKKLLRTLFKFSYSE